MARFPHIIFISDDQHRYDWLGWTNVAPVRTPHLDRLRREGIWHRQVYATNPLCMPSRCSLMTGLYSHQSGQINNDRDWPMERRTMAQALQQNGYRTAMIGKLHAFEAIPKALDLTTVRDTVTALGFDDVVEVAGKAMAWYIDCDWTHDLKKRGLLERYRGEKAIRTSTAVDGHVFPLEEENYSDRFIGNHVVEWLEGYDRPEPFFLWAGFCSPHFPYDAPTSWLERYAPESMPFPLDNPNPGNWPVLRAHYAAMIDLVDHEIGRVLETLKRRGWLDDMLVIFVSDHGEMLGEHGLDGKCWPFDPSIRVPCVARWPGRISPGTVSDGLVSLIDVTATCVAAGGLEPELVLPETQGRALLDHWKNPASPHRRFIFSENGDQFHPPWRLIRTLEGKGVDHYREKTRSYYDLIRDPGECRDLSRQTDGNDFRRNLDATMDGFMAAKDSPDRQRELSFFV